MILLYGIWLSLEKFNISEYSYYRTFILYFGKRKNKADKQRAGKSEMHRRGERVKKKKRGQFVKMTASKREKQKDKGKATVIYL